MIVLNPEPLDFSFLPETLPHREREIERIESIFISPVMDGLQTSLLIHGISGTGKTATVRYVMRRHPEISFHYINSLAHTSVRSVLNEFASGLGLVLPPGPINYSVIFRRIASKISQQRKPVVLVIDEFSSIARADFEGIYNLLRAREVHGVSIPTVLVSLDNPLVYFKESEIRSIGNVESLKFLRYGVGELRDIVSDRVDRAITPGACSDEVIDYIADISEQYGSARVAIEVLQKSAYIAEYRQSAEIGIDDVRAAKSMINPYITESKLASLMEEDLVVLLAVCRCLVSSRYCESSCIMQEVSVIAEDFLGSPMPASRASGVLRKLETVGLVDSRVIGQPGDSRKVYGISEVPVSVLSRKIISMLGKKQ